MPPLTIRVAVILFPDKMSTKVFGAGLGRELDGLKNQSVKVVTKRVAITIVVVADSPMNLQVNMRLCQVPSCFNFLDLNAMA
jgi:hypothetical protein